MLATLFQNLQEYIIDSNALATADNSALSQSIIELKELEKTSILVSFQESLAFDTVLNFAVTKTPKVGQKITQKGGRVITCDPAKTYPCGMGEGGFFRSDSKSVEFRDWLNSRGGTSEKLPEGSFKTSDNPTGVNTRLVIIEKPGRRDFSEFTWSQENIEYFKNFKTPCRTILSY